MKKYNNRKTGIAVLIGISGILLICILVWSEVMKSKSKVVISECDIKKGTVLQGESIHRLFKEEELEISENESLITDISEIEGMIVAEDIGEGSVMIQEMLIADYEPVSSIKEPVVIGIHAGEAAQFVSGIIRRGDTINVSVVDEMNNECEKILENVYVCGAYNDDGTSVEGEGSAMSLNILVEKEDEVRIHRLLNKGKIIISKTGGGLNE